MTPSRFMKLVRSYQGLLYYVTPQKGPYDDLPTTREAERHVAWMLTQMEDHLGTDGRRVSGKANRWIGFIQGVLWVCGIFTINQLRDHTRRKKKP